MHPVGDELFHVDGQRDRHDEAVAFHNLVNETKNGTIFYSQKSVKEMFWL
jgi:hypothetical protein